MVGRRPSISHQSGLSSGRLVPSDPLQSLRFIRPSPFASTITPAAPKTINWLIPNFGIGSGGHLNIFRFIWHLERLGWRCHLAIVGAHQWPSPHAAEEVIRLHFLPIEARVYLRPEDMPASEIGVATSWETAYPLRDWQSCHVKAYFVQDLEYEFFPKSSYSAFAEQTYTFGFYGITAGTWLSDTLRSNYGGRASAFSFSYDKHLYKRLAPVSAGAQKSPPRQRLLYYARPPTPRRGFELGLMVLEQVSALMPSVEIVTAGWDLSGFKLHFPHTDLGTLPLKKLCALYNSCDAALVISFTNMSLMPLELAACGCVVVSNKAPCVTWGLNDSIAELAEPTVEDLTQACLRILSDTELRKKKSDAAFAFAQSTDWATEADKLNSIFTSLLQDTPLRAVA